MYKVCLNCGAQLPENAKFCDRCGTALPPQAIVSATVSTKCVKCGATIKSEDHFCGGCGNIIDPKLFADKPTSQNYSDTANKNSIEGSEFTEERSASATESSEKQNCDEQTSACDSNDAQTAENAAPTSTNATEIPIKPQGKKKYIFIVVSIFMAILISCCLLSGGEENKVRNAYMTQYDTEISVGEAFENRFEDCKWSIKREEGNTFVNFTGYDTETLIDWKVIFKIKGEQFVVSKIQLDEQVITDTQELHYLMSYIYTGNWNALWGDALLYSLFS